MKFLKFMTLGVIIATMFAACNKDSINGTDGPDGPDKVSDGVFMGLTIKMPSPEGSKSSTTTGGQSSSGKEVGSDSENFVNNVIIVLAKASDNSYIASGTVSKDKLTAVGSDNSYKTVTKLTKTELNDYYKTADFSTLVHVFVFVNPDGGIKTVLENAKLGNTEWYNSVCTSFSEIWATNYFLMSNYSIAERQLPATIEEWDAYKTEANAFDLSGLNAGGTANEVNNSASVSGRGAVKVQRCAARFDFKDGSPTTTAASTYDVVKVKSGEETKVAVQIHLGSLALTNISKSFYYLPRVSTDGQLAGSVLCGMEEKDNYLVSPNALEFNTGKDNSIMSGFNKYFNSPLFTNNNDKIDYNRDGWKAVSIEKVLAGTSDNWGEKTYKVWDYATENVIPAEPVNQKMGISTVVVFKGRMIPSDWAKSDAADETTKTLAKTLTDCTGDPYQDPILYSLNHTLYVTWPAVQKAAIATAIELKDDAPVTVDGKLKVINRNDPLYVAVFGNGGMGTFTWGTKEYTDDLPMAAESANKAWEDWNRAGKPGEGNATLTEMRAAVTEAGFTIYQSSKDKTFAGGEGPDVPGYYCYYYYKNRHNDNGLNGTMGPMEFSVVRNNVYKLAVTNIAQLGHPRIPENDPDNPGPDTPDESDDIYLTVTCEVLPWVVRVNNIEF